MNVTCCRGRRSPRRGPAWTGWGPVATLPDSIERTGEDKPGPDRKKAPMSTAVLDKSPIVGEYQRADGDTGSPEVQVAILTTRIAQLTGHLKTHRRDFSSRRGLMMMVGRRTRLLRYLARKDRDAYQNLIKRLGLRK